MNKKFRDFAIGDRVELTGKFLRNTGQHTGPEGMSTWVITGFTNEGRHAITDEPKSDTSYYTAEEMAADPTLCYRRIAVENLYIVGQLDSRNCP